MAATESTLEKLDGSASKDPSPPSRRNGESPELQRHLGEKEHLEPVSSNSSHGTAGLLALDDKPRPSRALQPTRSYGDGYGHVCLPHDKPEFGGESSSRHSSEENFVVSFDGEDDPMSPRSMTKFRKWLIVVIVSLSSTCVYVLDQFRILDTYADILQNLYIICVYLDL
jgi:hypothetical protein